MAVECGLGKIKRSKLLLFIVILIVVAVWFGYDGWISEEYKTPDQAGDRQFNQLISVVAIIALPIMAVRLVLATKTKLVADENGIDVNDGKVKIAWSDLTGADYKKIDKGLVRLFYKQDGEEASYLLDSHAWSSFDLLLDEISRRRPDVLPPEEDEGDSSDQTT